MARQSADDVKKELEVQDEDYGDGEDYSSAPDPDKATRPTREKLEKVIGNVPDKNKEGFSIAEEVDKDERAIQVKPINDYSDSSGTEEQEAEEEEE